MVTSGVADLGASPVSSPVEYRYNKYSKRPNIRVNITYPNFLSRINFNKTVYKILLKDRPIMSNKRYSVFTKIQFNRTEYRTVGDQEGFTLHN